MLKRLQIKFVVINMTLVCLVLAVVLAVQITSGWQQVRRSCDTALEMALTWDEGGPGRWELGGRQGPGDPERDGRPAKPPPEQPGVMFPTVCVTLDGAGQVVGVQDNNADISQEVLTAAISACVRDGADAGVVDGLNLRFQMRTVGESVRIAFMDRTWERWNLHGQIFASLAVFFGAFLAFLAVSVFLSRWALRPVERSWAQQQQFVADASHELKTPLTVMLADAEILLSHPEESIESQRKWVEYIREEARRMKQLVEDMLFLARSDSDAGRERVSAQAALSDVVWSGVLSFEPVAFERGVVLNSEIAPQVAVRGDGDALRRLVMILLDNACKYAGQGGTVELVLKRAGDKVMLSVHNTGQPIPPEVQEHLFERFYRADSARERETGGYGLGLAIAQSIVQSHGGKITVASAEGEGTVFTAVLPCRI